jgi:hypothetical protein
LHRFGLRDLLEDGGAFETASATNAAAATSTTTCMSKPMGGKMNALINFEKRDKSV